MRRIRSSPRHRSCQAAAALVAVQPQQSVSLYGCGRALATTAPVAATDVRTIAPTEPLGAEALRRLKKGLPLAVAYGSAPRARQRRCGCRQLAATNPSSRVARGVGPGPLA